MTQVIQFQNVSKKFILQKDRARSFQEKFVSMFSGRRTPAEEVWVLNNVSFDIQAGETVALVGPNGTGKSTTLKLISGIMFPNQGEIIINGRVGGLLELGAGFHTDLTGRENIYLNGSILGLSRRELDKRFDEIVAFSELERFINMPVKHYSSGMFMRLGFSIAVHINPEILLVDEVLAVGDAGFQRKCLDKIDQLKQQGITILLVSHSADMIRKVCKRSIWIEKGIVLDDGVTEDVLQKYTTHIMSQTKSEVPAMNTGRWGSGEVLIEAVRILNSRGEESKTFSTGEPLVLEMDYLAKQRIPHPAFGLAIYKSDGTHLTGPNNQFAGYDIEWIEGKGCVRYTVSSLPLLEGKYHVTVAVHDQKHEASFDYHEQLYSFNVLPVEFDRYGLVTLNGRWQHTYGKE